MNKPHEYSLIRVLRYSSSLAEMLVSDIEKRKIKKDIGPLILSNLKIEELSLSSVQHRTDTLSPKQLDAARYAALGQTVNNIATFMGIRPKTVESHLAEVYLRLKIHCRTELTIWAVRNGVIEI